MLPAGFAALLAVGTVAAGLHGRLDATGVLICCAVVVGGARRGGRADRGGAARRHRLADRRRVLPAALRRPAADRRGRRAGGDHAGRDRAARGGRGRGSAAVVRAGKTRDCGQTARKRHRSPRRQLAGGAIAAVGLPALTALLTSFGSQLDLSDDLLIYLVAVVAVTVVGGFWPGVFAAVAACLLLNWYFTEPLHTFTIAEPRNLLALVLFVTVAVAVSSVVHLAARREADASRSAQGDRSRCSASPRPCSAARTRRATSSTT